ncbi:hypothetical protein D3C86_1432810 [compost metagenome]
MAHFAAGLTFGLAIYMKLGSNPKPACRFIRMSGPLNHTLQMLSKHIHHNHGGKQ